MIDRFGVPKFATLQIFSRGMGLTSILNTPNSLGLVSDLVHVLPFSYDQKTRITNTGKKISLRNFFSNEGEQNQNQNQRRIQNPVKHLK